MDYKRDVQKALGYIEKHLQDELTVEMVAKAAGFSKYHFHRVFEKQLGIPIYDYIRKRRLASTAALLLHSNLSIIDIAFLYRFLSGGRVSGSPAKSIF